MDGSSGTVGFIKEEDLAMMPDRLPDSSSVQAQEVASERNSPTNASQPKLALLIPM